MAKRLNWTVLMDDTSYLCVARMPSGSFVFVEVIDMDDACGRDNEGQPPFVVDVSLVDLVQVSEEQLRSAQESCGWEDMEDDDGNLSDVVKAEMCFQYGCKAPMYSESGGTRDKDGDARPGGWKKLIAEGKREATLLASDEDELSERMGRTVNKLGSTAAEYMRGDMHSAIQRGVEKGDKRAMIMAKMHGVPQHVIEEVATETRPADFLPYVMGYMDAMAGRERQSEGKKVRGVYQNKLAPEYHQGYDRGLAVREGQAVPPSWIKTNNGYPPGVVVTP